MSWDIDLMGEIDGHPVNLGSWNYTHNTNRMIREAGFTDWSMDEIQGMSAREFATRLGRAIDTLVIKPEQFREMDAQNGWGSYDTLVPVLRELHDQARRFPSATMHASF